MRTELFGPEELHTSEDQVCLSVCLTVCVCVCVCLCVCEGGTCGYLRLQCMLGSTEHVQFVFV